MDSQNKLIIIIVVVIAIFFGGYGVDYFKWGKTEEQPPDYKVLLKDAVGYIEGLERREKELDQRLSAAAKTNASSKQEMTSAENQDQTMLKDLQAKIETLEKENAELQKTISQNENLAAENRQLKERLQTYVNEINTMKSHLDKIQTLGALSRINPNR